MAERKRDVMQHPVVDYIGRTRNVLQNQINEIRDNVNVSQAKTQSSIHHLQEKLFTKLESIETNTQKGLKQNRKIRREISIMQRRCSICIALITFVLVTSLIWLYVLTDMHTSLTGIVSNLNDTLSSFGSTMSTTKQVSDAIDNKMKLLFDEKEKESKIESKELKDQINNLTDNVEKNHNDLQQLKEEIKTLVKNVQNNQDESDVTNKLNQCIRIEFNKAKEKKRAQNMFFCNIDWDDTEYDYQNKKAKDICAEKVLLYFVFLFAKMRIRKCFLIFSLLFSSILLLLLLLFLINFVHNCYPLIVATAD